MSMEPFTQQELQRFAPSARPEYVDALVNGWSEIERAGIDTPLRLCEFLAQTAHETGGYTIISENLNYTAKRMCEVWPTRFRGALDPKAMLCAGQPEKLAEVVYGGRLGNIEKGDAYDYRGRSFLQDTGRDTYVEYGRIIGCDLEGQPELLDKPTVGLRVALARWQKLNLNRFADRHYTRAIGNAINRGNAYSSHEPIGHKSRMAWFARAWVLFGEDGEVMVPPGLALGAHGVRVESLQNRLRDLGYGTGAIDKVFGPSTARAVAGFKLDHKRRTGQDLEPDEVVGPLTEAALEGAAKIEISPERLETTEKDLIAAGSSEMLAGQRQKVAGYGITGLALAGGAEDHGVLPVLQQQVGWVPQAQSFLVPVIDAIRWGLSNLVWVVLIGFGVWVWSGGVKTMTARLKAHRFGFNLFR